MNAEPTDRPLMTMLTLRAPKGVKGPRVRVYGEIVAADHRTVTLEHVTHNDWHGTETTRRDTFDRGRIVASTAPLPVQLDPR